MRQKFYNDRHLSRLSSRNGRKVGLKEFKKVKDVTHKQAHGKRLCDSIPNQQLKRAVERAEGCAQRSRQPEVNSRRPFSNGCEGCRRDLKERLERRNHANG